MITGIIAATKAAQVEWKEFKAPVQVKSLINQLSLDIQAQMDHGEWGFAVKLSLYRHEIAKLYNTMVWYEPSIEIRKTRDLIDLLVGANDDRAEKNRAEKATRS